MGILKYNIEEALEEQMFLKNQIVLKIISRISFLIQKSYIRNKNYEKQFPGLISV